MVEQQLESKEKIIKAAIDLFSARGFRGTSIRDIARSMGMSISNIYHYFGNKEGLLLAILTHSSENLLKELRDVAMRDTDPLLRFRDLVTTHLRFSGQYTKEMRIFFLDEEQLSKEGELINKQFQRAILSIYRQQLETLQDKGYLPDRNITAMAFNILGMLNWQPRWYRHDGPLTPEQAIEEVISFIFHGILGAGCRDGIRKRRQLANS